MSQKQLDQDYIAGLLAERVGRKKDRVEAIDAELARMGYEFDEETETATVEPVTEKAVVVRKKAKAKRPAKQAKVEPEPEPEPSLDEVKDDTRWPS